MDSEAMKLSADIINRLRVWEETFRRAYEYLLSVEKIDQPGVQKSDYVIYKYGSYHKILTRNKALLEASVIHFMSVFGIGFAGNMMISNKDETIEKLRNDIINDCLITLEWTRESFDKLFEKIKAQRDGLLAHYDGNVADFKEEAVGLSSRKMVGIHLMTEDLSKYEELVKVFHEKTFQLAYREQNNT